MHDDGRAVLTQSVAGRDHPPTRQTCIVQGTEMNTLTHFKNTVDGVWSAGPRWNPTADPMRMPMHGCQRVWPSQGVVGLTAVVILLPPYRMRVTSASGGSRTAAYKQ